MFSTLGLMVIQTTEKVLTGIGEEPNFDFNPDFFFKILLAIGAGLLIGIEREYKGKDAGLKTNMLVAVGACAFVILSLQYQGGKFIDLTRVLSQVVTGIGFLGAGVILKKGGTVQGLTTAATIWCSAAAGCIAALYLVTDLILFTGTVLLVNLIFGSISKRFDKER
ncbi:MgtC/SapB family protein [Gelidibacter sp. F2691]|nr:MgtC/SapB family protein [Gelidibacter sp. F2691]